MTDTVPTAAPISGLSEALTASLSAVAEMSFDECLARKNALLGNARSFEQLTQDELSEFHAISTRLRQLAQPAGKPAAKPRGGKAAPVAVDAVADDFA